MKDTINFLVKKTIILCLLPVMFAGCASSPPARFYLLSPISNGAEDQYFAGTPSCFNIGVGPVRLPEYANRPQIVTRTSQTELSRAQFDLWAEPLPDTFSRVIAKNLTRLVCTNRIYIFPWDATVKPDYLVRANVMEMKGSLDDKAYLEIQWSIWGVMEGRELFQKRSTYSETVIDGTYEGLVQTYSNMIGQLSHDIAKALEGL